MPQIAGFSSFSWLTNIYTHHIFFNPLICWWTFGLFPPFGCCEQCQQWDFCLEKKCVPLSFCLPLLTFWLRGVVGIWILSLSPAPLSKWEACALCHSRWASAVVKPVDLESDSCEFKFWFHLFEAKDFWQSFQPLKAFWLLHLWERGY